MSNNPDKTKTDKVYLMPGDLEEEPTDEVPCKPRHHKHVVGGPNCV